MPVNVLKDFPATVTPLYASLNRLAILRSNNLEVERTALT